MVPRMRKKIEAISPHIVNNLNSKFNQIDITMGVKDNTNYEEYIDKMSGETLFKYSDEIAIQYTNSNHDLHRMDGPAVTYKALSFMNTIVNSSQPMSNNIITKDVYVYYYNGLQVTENELKILCRKLKMENL